MTDLRRSRALLFSSLLALVAAASGCSDDGDSNAAASGSSGSAMGGAGGGGAGGGGGTAAYEDAVKAASWTKLEAAPSLNGGPKQDDIFFLDAERGFLASGPEWSIFATTDGGASWSTLLDQQGTFFRALLFTDAMRGFAGNIGSGLAAAIDDPNVMYQTADGGVSWTPVTNITGPAPKGICNFSALDDSHLFAVGRANGPSHLLTSADGGDNWTSIDLSPWLSMAIDVRFSSPMEGVVAGMGAGGSMCTIVRTNDGGASFETVFTSNTNGSLCWKLHFPSDEVGYVAVQDTSFGPGTFGKTTDGGITWQEMPLPATQAYGAIGVGFATENIGWIVADDPALPAYRTYDGGMNWEVEPNLQGPINRFRFVDKNTAYAVGGAVYKLNIDYQR